MIGKPRRDDLAAPPIDEIPESDCRDVPVRSHPMERIRNAVRDKAESAEVVHDRP